MYTTLKSKDERSNMANIYECDPKKNVACKKTGCYLDGGPCHCTTHQEYEKEQSNRKKAVKNGQSKGD